MKPQFKLTMLLFLGSMLALSGCQSMNKEVPKVEKPVVSQPPATTVPDLAEPAVPEEQSDNISARLTDFTLLDDQKGFVWGLSEDNEFRLYFTKDNGKHWKNISPEEGTLQMSGSPVLNRGISFLDAEQIWIAADQELYTTSDGGATWHSAALPESQLLSIQQLADGRGYALTSTDAAMNHSQKSLYVTEDGGTSWKKIMDNEGATEENTSALPFTGHANIGMTFLDHDNGWVPLTPPDDLPHLYRTKDGGVTWQQVTLAVPDELEEQGLMLSSAPVFFEENQKAGWVSAISFRPDGKQLYGYFTQDGGDTWTLADFGKEALINNSKGYVSSFISREEGWIVADGKVLHTKDGGSSWEIYKHSLLKEQMEQLSSPLALHFTSSQHGWLLLGDEDGTKSVLMSTNDGGQHWNLK